MLGSFYGEKRKTNSKLQTLNKKANDFENIKLTVFVFAIILNQQKNTYTICDTCSIDVQAYVQTFYYVRLSILF